jgi:hypothetical protein
MVWQRCFGTTGKLKESAYVLLVYVIYSHATINIFKIKSFVGILLTKSGGLRRAWCLGYTLRNVGIDDAPRR